MLMNRPRCGFPDVAEFGILQGSKWNKTNLTYGYQNFTPDLTQAQTRTAIAQAFGLWSAVTPLTFTEVPMGSNPRHRDPLRRGQSRGWQQLRRPRRGVGARLLPAAGRRRVLAGDTHFDEAETWSVNLPASGIDLVTVAGHEFGHALGLAHSSGHRRPRCMPTMAAPIARWKLTTSWASRHSTWGVARNGMVGRILAAFSTSGVGVSSWAANRLDCFVRGTDNAMYHKWWNGSSWLGWENLGGILTSAPAAVSWGPNRIDTFVRGTDNRMYHKWWNGSSWLGWENLGGILTSGIGVSSWAANRLDLLRARHRQPHVPQVVGTAPVGSAGTIWAEVLTPRCWWPFPGGRTGSTPSCAAPTTPMWHKWWNGSSWSGWENLGGVLTSAPGRSVPGPQTGWIASCVAPTTPMWHKWWNESRWQRLGEPRRGPELRTRGGILGSEPHRHLRAWHGQSHVAQVVEWLSPSVVGQRSVHRADHASI